MTIAKGTFLDPNEIRVLSERRDRIEACARAAYETSRAYCLTIGDDTQKSWEAAEQCQRDAAMRGIRTVLDGATPEESHEAWCRDKISDGWKYGSVKDSAKKEHPCLVSYVQFPEVQKRKDAIYITVICAMAKALDLKVCR